MHSSSRPDPIQIPSRRSRRFSGKSSQFKWCSNHGSVRQPVRCHNAEMSLREKGHGEQSAGSGSIGDVVQRAEAKLALLQAKRQHIRRRLQALRYLTNHAEERVDEVPPKKYATRPTRTGDHAQDTITRSKYLPQISDSQSRLRRACRIALLESQRPQNCVEICQRINRRGSWSFASYTDALEIIATHLQAMVEDAEILCSVVGGETLWHPKSQ